VAFEYLDHTADTAVRLRARDGPDLFREATRALLSILLDEAASAPAAAVESIDVRLEAEDAEALLIDYLNELIFLFDSRRFLAAELEVGVLRLEKPALLEAVVKGETYDPARHKAKTEIKAATFHGLEIRRTGGGLEADVVFDL
jgi:SHS2 domain-containing protein